MKRKALIAVGVVAALVGGCAVGPGYYWQAAKGQMDVLDRAEEIEKTVKADETSPQLRQRLQLAAEVREFASAELGLPNNGSFRRYADLGRKYVAWNVYANPPLSMQPQTWCLPVAGCVSYLGFFSESEARARAAELKAEGLDVEVGGVPAYSTLGWFKDPLLNTFINWPEAELARLIFHELSHQIVYVKNDTEFNESFAATVEEAGVRKWLSQPGKEAMLAQFERSLTSKADFSSIVVKYRDLLNALYESDMSVTDKLASKRELLAQMQEEYKQIKSERWGGAGLYDSWFGREVNNARLASIGLYKGLVPSFRAVLAQEGHDLERFYQRVRTLSEMEPLERRAALDDARRTYAENVIGTTAPELMAATR